MLAAHSWPVSAAFTTHASALVRLPPPLAGTLWSPSSPALNKSERCRAHTMPTIPSHLSVMSNKEKEGDGGWYLIMEGLKAFGSNSPDLLVNASTSGAKELGRSFERSASQLGERGATQLGRSVERSAAQFGRSVERSAAQFGRSDEPSVEPPGMCLVLIAVLFILRTEVNSLLAAWRKSSTITKIICGTIGGVVSIPVSVPFLSWWVRKTSLEIKPMRMWLLQSWRWWGGMRSNDDTNSSLVNGTDTFQ
jgi:hypothetical protein